MRAVWDEVVGLFVDDGWYAGLILAWVGVCWAVLPRFGEAGWAPWVLFGGLATILVGGAVRR